MSTSRIVTRVTDLIGHTPLFQLCRTAAGTRLLLKLEQFNPTGAAKIRMARQMILDAERTGDLRPGGRIVESTSGNTGLGLAVMAAERGYRFTAVVDHHACRDKLAAMRAMGAELVYASAGDDTELATSAREDLAAKLAAEDDSAFFTEQHNNPSNALGYRAVAHELTAALGNSIDYLICPVGTGGSLFGTARELRANGIDVTVVGVEPVGSIAFGGPGGPYYQSGTGTPPGAVVGSAVDYGLLDEGVKVSDMTAFATVRAIARHCGLLIGGSAGGAVYAALQRVTTLPAGTTAVTLVCDGGEKYLDTVFDDSWMRDRDLLALDLEADILRLLSELSDDRGGDAAR